MCMSTRQQKMYSFSQVELHVDLYNTLFQSVNKFSEHVKY